MRIKAETAKLQKQCPIIAESQARALQEILSNQYMRATGLQLEHPPELWQLVISRSEQFFDSELHQQWRKKLGRPMLRQILLSLASRIEDEDTLLKHLATVQRIAKRGVLTEADFNRRGIDGSTQILIGHWINLPLEGAWATDNLCFFSNRAMAKLLYFLRHKRWLLPAHLEKEKERIKKIYRRLGLIPARPRLIR